MEATIQFETAQELQDIIGRRGEYLPRMGRELGVHLIGQETLIKLDGEAPAIARATNFFERLRAARREGNEIHEQTIAYALRAFVEGREGDLEWVGFKPAKPPPPVSAGFHNPHQKGIPAAMETIIQFENAREMQDLTGRRGEQLPRIGRELGVRLTGRDTWVRIEGEVPAVNGVARFFERLRAARREGNIIREHTITYALRAFAEGREGDLEQLYQGRIDVSLGKPPVFPRTFGQQRYVEAIRANDICFGIGPAGTGKTYLAMAMAVNSLLRGEVSRIVLTRPAVEAGEALGFLPGDLRAKVSPYLRPLYDAMYDMMGAEDIERQIERGVIEVAPLAYMRGRTLNHAFVILDEAQNTTPEQMLMFLTRLGFDSKCVITGDLTQLDLPPNKISGLLEAFKLLKGVEGIAFTELKDDDVVRHELVQRVIQAYREGRLAERQKKQT
ncbi:MAG: PhoH family protein [Kiritimatiellaeota bacterium]|nr:PhoH family protein [Kiritimatiellota bacterium]